MAHSEYRWNGSPIVSFEAASREREWHAAAEMSNKAHFRYLMSVPAECYGRAKTRDLVPFSEKTLQRLAKPFLSPTMAFKAQTVGPWNKTIKYREWLRSIGALPVAAPRKARLPRRPKAAPMFTESAPEAWRDLPCDVPTL